MSSVEQVHEEKETIVVDVNIPGHDARVTTSLFERTRAVLIEREGGVCSVCNRTAEESGHPLEAHHHPIERSFAEMIDWPAFAADARAGKLVEFPHAAAFNWDTFDPANPYTFVDDMTANGLLLCKDHHTAKDMGIHMLPYPIWLVQRYGRDGYVLSILEVIHHEGPLMPTKEST